MNIAVALNQKYFYYTYVMLTSLFENNKDSSVRVFVLHSDLDDESISAFSDLAAQYKGEVQAILIDRTFFPKDLPFNEQWSLEMYYRLMLPDILPHDVDRILYIDVDTIVNQSIREFYETDFEEKYFVVCRDIPAEKLNDIRRQETFRFLFEQGNYYFNSGVMLWNIQALRGKYHLRDYLETAKALEGKLVAPDQDILNYVHWEHVKYADETRYDLFARVASNEGFTYEKVKNETAIIHFAGTKPWNGDNVHFDIEMLWWDYAKKTPYYAQLCEEFIQKTMFDKTMLMYVQQILRENEQLKSNLNESLAINEKLFQLIK